MQKKYMKTEKKNDKLEEHAVFDVPFDCKHKT